MTVPIYLLFSIKLTGQTAVLSGTNYVSGSGFCFGDQQLKEGTPFISCASSGFTGEVNTYFVFWSIDGSVLSGSQVEAKYPDHIEVVTPQPGESRLNILNGTSLEVSSVACRVVAFYNGGDYAELTPLSTRESVSVVKSKYVHRVCYIHRLI